MDNAKQEAVSSYEELTARNLRRLLNEFKERPAQTTAMRAGPMCSALLATYAERPFPDSIKAIAGDVADFRNWIDHRHRTDPFPTLELRFYQDFFGGIKALDKKLDQQK